LALNSAPVCVRDTRDPANTGALVTPGQRDGAQTGLLAANRRSLGELNADLPLRNQTSHSPRQRRTAGGLAVAPTNQFQRRMDANDSRKDAGVTALGATLPDRV